MESEILKQLKKAYPTAAAQQERLREMIGSFGTLRDREMKIVVGDILCLAKLLYEAGQEEIIYDLRDQLTALERQHRQDSKYLSKLEYLNKCLTNFKPAIFRNLQLHFSELYHVDPALVTCLPKVTGQQVGAEVEIALAAEDTKPIKFHVKTHQEFCSKSHSQLVVTTSDGTGAVNFKELFVYKLLQYLGYGPKTHFIVDRDIAHSRTDEGILIATQDLGYTKRPEQVAKSFRIFRDVRDDLSQQEAKSINEATRRDIIVIDMLSRALLLEDVIINQGNFGMVTVNSTKDDGSPAKIKWKILDFMPPNLLVDKGDDYSYNKHYASGITIFHAFKVGNASHTYARDELMVIHRILTEENARDLWLPALQQLTTARGNHMPLAAAMERAFQDIDFFMKKNQELLQIKPERLARRMEDLARYRDSTTRNFEELDQGIRDYLRGASAAAAPQP